MFGWSIVEIGNHCSIIHLFVNLVKGSWYIFCRSNFQCGEAKMELWPSLTIMFGGSCGYKLHITTSKMKHKAESITLFLLVWGVFQQFCSLISYKHKSFCQADLFINQQLLMCVLPSCDRAPMPRPREPQLVSSYNGFLFKPWYLSGQVEVCC